MIYQPNILKRCSHCHERKFLHEFSKAKSSQDGAQSFCKQCNREYGVRQYIENGEKEHARHKLYYETHKEQVLLSQSDYYARHKTRILARDAAHYAAHKEEKRNYQEKYQ